jgi:hypothetical protein
LKQNGQTLSSNLSTAKREKYIRKRNTKKEKQNFTIYKKKHSPELREIMNTPVIHCCVTNCLKLTDLKQPLVIGSHISMGQEFRPGPDG